MAAASCESMLNVLDPKLYVSLSKKRMYLDAARLQYESDFLDKLASLSARDRANTVFDLLDRDCDGDVDKTELLWTLQGVNGENSHSEIQAVANQCINSFVTFTNGKLDKDEFVPFLETLSGVLECNTWDLCQHICTVAVFQAETGQSILQDAVNNLMCGSQISKEIFTDACTEARLLMVFDMLDVNQSGEISFTNFVHHLHANPKLQQILPREIGIMLDQLSRRSKKLGYEQFSDIIRAILQSVPCGLNVNILADSLTVAVVEQSSSKSLMKQFDNDLVYDSFDAEVDDCIDSPPKERLELLFQLFDDNKNGTVDLEELVMGLRKFATKKDMDETFSDSMDALSASDANGDGALDLTEFSFLLQKFAAASHVHIHDLIDFMIMRSVLLDRDLDDAFYVAEQIKEVALEA